MASEGLMGAFYEEVAAAQGANWSEGRRVEVGFVEQPATRGGTARWRSANDPRLSRTEILSLLREAPGRIAGATTEVDADELERAPARGQWSVARILAHLRSCADVWGGAIATILDEDRPTIRAISPRTWLDGTDYAELAFEVSFPSFVAQREALLAVLEPLPVEAWGRSAIVTGAGAVLERTMHWYALGLAAHERSHVRQIERQLRAAR